MCWVSFSFDTYELPRSYPHLNWTTSTMRHLLVLGVCIALASTSYGQVISVSFAGDNGGGNGVSIGGLDPTDEVAGVVPTANWNSDDFFLDEGDLANLLDDSGDATTAAVEWAGSANTWGGTGATTEDEMMVNGWLDDNGAGATIDVTGIPYENYDLYVYGSSDAGNGGRGFTTQVNGVDYFSNGAFVDPVTDNGSFFDPEVGYVNALSLQDNPSFFKIGGLSGDELTIFGGRNQAGPAEPNGISDFRGGVSGFQIVDCGGECEVEALPPSSVAGSDNIGGQNVSGARSNLVLGEAGENVPGLGQSWYAIANPGSKEGVDAIFNDNDPSVPYFQADGGTSWWSGSADVIDVPKYPAEVDGVITGDNYTVKLEGEILIEEQFITFLDGVDDFTYLAIDVDRSGVAGDSDGDVLINDNAWTNALSDGNGGGVVVEVEFEDLAADGEWLAIEFNMAEGGGGDHGMLYWDAGEDGEFLPTVQGEGVIDGDAAVLLVPDTHLRSPESPPEVLSGEISGAVPPSNSGWEFEINTADGTSDAFVLDNPDADAFTTTLDVDGAEFILNVDGDVAEGDSFQIVVADNITGTPTISPEGWNFDPATGSVVFGELASCNPNTMGDLDGSGDVAFADFLILSNNFGSEVSDHTAGDIDCSGDVAFADFLILSNNFGQAVGAETSSVPEPSSCALLCLAGLCGGLLRRRR